jgi:hypothetical protein
MSDENKEIVKRTTVTIVQRESLRSYPGMTLEEAAKYERELDHNEKIQMFMESLSYIEEKNLYLSQLVTIEDKLES